MEPNPSPNRRLFQDSLLFFAQSIEDPNVPKHCALCLLGCNQVIGTNEPDQASEAAGSEGLSVGLREDVLSEESELNAADTVFCRAIVSLLTIPRTGQAISAFLARLSECSCSDIAIPLISHFHERGRECINSELWSHKTTSTFLIASLFKQLAGQVSQGGAVRVAKGKGKRWPISVADIIPFGPSALVTTVGQWMIVLDEPTMPLQLLQAALPVCGRPLFVTISSSSIFLKQLLISMKAIYNRIEEGTHRLMDATPFVQIAGFLYAVMSCRTSENSMMVWVRGHETKLWAAFTDAIRIMELRRPAAIPSDEYDKIVAQMIGSFRSLIMQFSPTAIQPRQIHPSLVIAPGQTINHFPVYTKAGLMDIVTFLADLKRQRYCFVLGCPRSFQEIGNTFQKCSACNVPGYCSSACQAADWKARKFPHKVYCKKIKLFLSAAPGAKLDWDNLEKFGRKFDRNALPVGNTTLQDIADWSRARRADVEEWDLIRARNAMH